MAVGKLPEGEPCGKFGGGRARNVSEYQRVGSADEIPPGGAKRFLLGTIYVAVFHTEDGYVAIDDACSHRGEPLSAGTLEGGVLTCRFHGARYELATGRCKGRPGKGDVGVHQVRVVGDELQVLLGEVLSHPPSDDDWFDYA